MLPLTGRLRFQAAAALTAASCERGSRRQSTEPVEKMRSCSTLLLLKVVLPLSELRHRFSKSAEQSRDMRE